MQDYHIIHRAVTASTNLDARAGKPGDVFTADEQTAGRGRLDHRWHSAPGENLMMSVVVDATGLAPEHVATFPLVVGLAVAEALAPRLADRLVGLKWPNDVLVDGRKICGILCERVGDRVIAGIGINVNQRTFPAEIAARATSLASLTAVAVLVSDVRDVVLAALARGEAAWRAGGFAALQPAYAARDVLRGRRVGVRQTDDDAAPWEGLCAGVQADGTLSVAGKAVYAGEAHVLYAHAEGAGA